MSRTQRPFRQSDVVTALKGAKAAGLTVTRMEIDPEGKIVLIFGDQAENKAESALERWRRSQAEARDRSAK